MVASALRRWRKPPTVDYWIARPIELPKSRPLEFESSADVATELAEWPLNHVVKCLAFYHPDDEIELRERQERQLLRLFDACRKTRHELLLELILPKGMDERLARPWRAASAGSTPSGIRPDWWKLEPLTDPAAWREIEIRHQRERSAMPGRRPAWPVGAGSRAARLV
jgi:5-dehydro-2-deoxygluconokinase